MSDTDAIWVVAKLYPSPSSNNELRGWQKKKKRQTLSVKAHNILPSYTTHRPQPPILVMPLPCLLWERTSTAHGEKFGKASMHWDGGKGHESAEKIQLSLEEKSRRGTYIWMWAALWVRLASQIFPKSATPTMSWWMERGSSVGGRVRHASFLEKVTGETALMGLRRESYSDRKGKAAGLFRFQNTHHVRSVLSAFYLIPSPLPPFLSFLLTLPSPSLSLFSLLHILAYFLSFPPP